MSEIPCPMSGEEILDTYFLENRARILELAAFLDRIDRSRESLKARQDYRYRSLVKALEMLGGPQRKKTALIQMLFSDRSGEPIKSAEGLKATRAWARFVP